MRKYHSNVSKYIIAKYHTTHNIGVEGNELDKTLGKTRSFCRAIKYHPMDLSSKFKIPSVIDPNRSNRELLRKSSTKGEIFFQESANNHGCRN